MGARRAGRSSHAPGAANPPPARPPRSRHGAPSPRGSAAPPAQKKPRSQNQEVGTFGRCPAGVRSDDRRGSSDPHAPGVVVLLAAARETVTRRHARVSSLRSGWLSRGLLGSKYGRSWVIRTGGRDLPCALVPRLELHERCAARPLARVVGPPCARARTWSSVSGSPTRAGCPQSQHTVSSLRTCARTRR
jgi:hypothetical protein